MAQPSSNKQIFIKQYYSTFEYEIMTFYDDMLNDLTSGSDFFLGMFGANNTTNIDTKQIQKKLNEYVSLFFKNENRGKTHFY